MLFCEKPKIKKEEFVFFICKSHKLSAKKEPTHTHRVSEKERKLYIGICIMCCYFIYFCCLVPKIYDKKRRVGW